MIKPGRYVISIDQDGRLPRDKVRYRFIGCNPNEPEPPIKPSDPGDGEGADKAPPTVKFKPLSRARMRVIMRASIDKESKTSVWLKVKTKKRPRRRRASQVLRPGHRGMFERSVGRGGYVGRRASKSERSNGYALASRGRVHFIATAVIAIGGLAYLARKTLRWPWFVNFLNKCRELARAGHTPLGEWPALALI